MAMPEMPGGWNLLWSLVTAVVGGLMVAWRWGRGYGSRLTANEAEHKALQGSIDTVAAQVDERLSAKTALLRAEIDKEIQHAVDSRGRLHEKVDEAAKALDEGRAEFRELGRASAVLKANVNGLSEDIKQARDDLKSAVSEDRLAAALAQHQLHCPMTHRAPPRAGG